MANIPLDVYVWVCVWERERKRERSLSIHLLMDTGCFHILATVNNVTMNIMVHVSFWNSVFFSLWINIQEWNCWSIWYFYFFFFRNFHNVFHSGSANWHSHWLCTRVPFSSNPHQLLLISCVFDDVHCSGCEVYLIVAYICISLIISDGEHLSMCLVPIYMSFWENVYSDPLLIS